MGWLVGCTYDLIQMSWRTGAYLTYLSSTLGACLCDLAVLAIGKPGCQSLWVGRYEGNTQRLHSCRVCAQCISVERGRRF